MYQRCTNPNLHNYDRYGGRGITVCEEWNDYETFRAWANETGYADELSIDRIDNDGDYEPNNCRWTDNETQANNTSRNIYVVIDGKRHTVAEWSKILGINSKPVYARINKGWALDENLFI